MNDIAGEVGGWLGGGARALDTFLSGDRNPGLNPQTRNLIRNTQAVGDVVSGGAVRAMQGGPDAVQRFAAQQAALYAAGLAAGPALGAAGKGLQKARNVPKVAKAISKAEARLANVMPVSAKTVRQMQRENAMMTLRIAERGQRRYVEQQQKTARMANQFIKQYEANNPVYMRAEAMWFEDVGDQYRAANAMHGTPIDIDRKAIHRNLNRSANEIFRETLDRMAKAENPRPGWQNDAINQLKFDIEEARNYQRARGILHRIGIERTRRLPKPDSIEKQLAAEFRAEELKDRVEVQLLRSALRRGAPPPRR